MSVWNDAETLRQVILGDRAEKSAAALVQNAATSLFTVSGGDILVTALYGKVSTVIGANAITVKLQHTPSGGSAGDISAATTITSDAVGTIYGVTGVAADILSAQKVTGTEVPTVTFGTVGVGARGIILPAGSLKMLASNADPDGGKITWRLFYVALAAGASVAAA